jgi:hypothetical protein
MAEDLTLRIQPRLMTGPDGHAFVGAAFQGLGITRARLGSPTERHGVFGQFGFGIFVSGSAWTLRPTGLGLPRETTDVPGFVAALRARTLAVLRSNRFAVLTPEMVPEPHCVICGKVLTDPVSIARWIGPESFGSATIVVPRTFIPAEEPSA